MLAVGIFVPVVQWNVTALHRDWRINMPTLQEMMAESPNGELDELSRRALALYREKLAAELEPEQDGKGLAIHPDSGDYLVANNPTYAGHAMRVKHPEGGFITLRIGLKPDYALLALMNGSHPKA
jgi:hypothetical protein